jgi:hypothetical protein
MTSAPVLTPVAAWRCSPRLLVALQQHLGDPLDTYVNGSQVWLREDGPGEMTLEWRLHPVAGYERPPRTSTEGIFGQTVFALMNEDPPPAPLDRLWGGLEVYPAFGNEIEPATLAALTGAILQLQPDAFGLVDHAAIGDAWERDRSKVDLAATVLQHLGA